MNNPDHTMHIASYYDERAKHTRLNLLRDTLITLAKDHYKRAGQTPQGQIDFLVDLYHQRGQ